MTFRLKKPLMRTTILLTAFLFGPCLSGSAHGQALFLTGGMGGAGIREGSGVNVTLGAGGMYRRVLGFVSAVDLTMIPTDQGNGRDFYRATLPNGQSRCIRRDNDRPVGQASDKQLCNVTDFQYAATGDLNLLLSSNFFAGGGIRVGSEVTPYVSLGLTLQSPTQSRYSSVPFVRGVAGKDLWAVSVGAALRFR
ncbi:hypothetical protein BH24GEM2_BH24GEM2_04740 [soil metagenome]